ncbi:MAG: YraN family protein [Endomicrobium sp.]|jgi:putative endonuclease|nr:YraN family protein [Endomicrobium sp.]
MVDTRTVGFEKEKEAIKFLQKRGYKIIGTNYVTIFGEIDIIAKNKGNIVFIEVKYRKNLSGGTPQEAVTKSKRKKIIKSAVLYVKQNGLKDSNIRFDVVSINDDKFEIIESAFFASGYFI